MQVLRERIQKLEEKKEESVEDIGPFVKPQKIALFPSCFSDPQRQFRKYLARLLGDKHEEHVMDVMSKVDKKTK